MLCTIPHLLFFTFIFPHFLIRDSRFHSRKVIEKRTGTREETLHLSNLLRERVNIHRAMRNTLTTYVIASNFHTQRQMGKYKTNDKFGKFITIAFFTVRFVTRVACVVFRLWCTCSDSRLGLKERNIILGPKNKKTFPPGKQFF